ncbi:MAG TPA: hypothetical protein VKR26_17325 [Terriglobales bacterium]|nr:hypothetical protein [Terriglobales bacterium]
MGKVYLFSHDHRDGSTQTAWPQAPIPQPPTWPQAPDPASAHVGTGAHPATAHVATGAHPACVATGAHPATACVGTGAHPATVYVGTGALACAGERSSPISPSGHINVFSANISATRERA